MVWLPILLWGARGVGWAGEGFAEDPGTGEVIVVFSNHPHVYAPRNALRFMVCGCWGHKCPVFMFVWLFEGSEDVVLFVHDEGYFSKPPVV